MIYLYPNAGECGAVYGITCNYQMCILPRNVCYANNRNRDFSLSLVYIYWHRQEFFAISCGVRSVKKFHVIGDFGIRLHIPPWLITRKLYGRVVGRDGVWYVEPIASNTLQRLCKKLNSSPTFGKVVWSVRVMCSFHRNCVSWPSFDVNKYSNTVPAVGWLSDCNAL